jgi:TM2 domain-containing membrane protein YozV
MDKTTFGILAILLGGLGIHKFVIGHTKWGVIYLLITVCTGGTLWIIPGVLGIIAGIKVLTGTEEDFQRYIEEEGFI